MNKESYSAGEFVLVPHQRLFQAMNGTLLLDGGSVALLALLMEMPGQPLSSEVISQRLYGYSDGERIRAVHSVVARLRIRLRGFVRRELVQKTSAGYHFVCGNIRLKR